MKKLLILILTTSLFANFTIEDGTVTIDSDVSVTLYGSINNSGTIINDGYIELYGESNSLFSKL